MKVTSESFFASHGLRPYEPASALNAQRAQSRGSVAGDITARIEAILTAPDAQGDLQKFARRLAFKTQIPTLECIELMRAARASVNSRPATPQAPAAIESENGNTARVRKAIAENPAFRRRK